MNPIAAPKARFPGSEPERQEVEPDIYDEPVDDTAICRPATEAEQVAKVMDLTAEEGEDAEELVMDSVPPEFEMPGVLSRAASEEKHVNVDIDSSRQFSKAMSFTTSFMKGPSAECCICCAELSSDTVCMLMRRPTGKRRSCRHYLHYSCAKLFMQSTAAPYCCPLCRQEFLRAEPLPDVRLNSRAWFHAIDDDDSGSLEKCEVIDALCATLAVDPEKLEAKLWSRWDFEGSGRITREAFEERMLQFVLYSLPSLKREVRSGAIPDIEQSRESWFRYWDEDNQRELDFLQCLRALARTLRIDGDCAEMSLLRKVLLELFQEFGLCEEMKMDSWLAQGDSRPVTQRLFCERPDGFCDRLLDQLKRSFGQSRFRRLQERARLLQLPVAELKRQIPHVAALEKAELVEAILNASSPSKVPPVPLAAPAMQTERGLTREEARAMPLVELQRRLRSVRVSYDHCLERRELEELLLSRSQPAQRCQDPREDGGRQRCWEHCRLH